MATISIKGIKLTKLNIGLDGDEPAIESEYALISSADKVLARQSVGGYNGMKLQPSAATIGALNAFLKLFRADVNTVLGLDSE